MVIDARVMEYNPGVSVRIPRNAPQNFRRALTDKEQQWIIDTPHRAQRAAMIMMYAGLRRGELIALTWDNIDLKNKTIWVNKSVEMIEDKLRVKAPKTKVGNRTVDIPQRLADFLDPLWQDHLAQFPSVQPINLLVC
ncbi:tyrosine-type recombinase/integrase [Caproicibacterium sp. NSD3]